MVQPSQGDVQRYVGVAASTVIGLVCYALSSSFTRLYGEWNSFKICVYIVSSSIIFLAILFPEAWQRWWIFKYRALFAFLVLISTTVYSFYLDRKLRTKPDAYGIISSAAFATMSLCMSKSIDCGFLDLMLFFCGVLITQLMEIKPLLGLVGIGFSYFLIIFRSRYFRNYEVIDIASPQPISNGASEISQPERPLGLLQMLSPQQQRLAELVQRSWLALHQLALAQTRLQQTPPAQQQQPLVQEEQRPLQEEQLLQEEQRQQLLQLPLRQLGQLLQMRQLLQMPLSQLLQMPLSQEQRPQPRLQLRQTPQLQEQRRLWQEEREREEREREQRMLDQRWWPELLQLDQAWWQELLQLDQEQHPLQEERQRLQEEERRRLQEEERRLQEEERRLQERQLHQQLRLWQQQRQQPQQQWHQQLRQRRTQLRQR